MSRVVLVPEVEVEIDGAPLAAADSRALAEVRVQQRLSLPTLCELTVRNPEGPLGDVPVAPGAGLQVRVAGHEQALFKGEVTATELAYDAANNLSVRIRGLDRLHRLRRRQPLRAHVQVTSAELACELVTDLDLRVEAVTPGPLWRRLLQAEQTDLELLVETAERCGLYLTLRDQVLHLLTLEGIGQALTLSLGGNLLEARIDLSSATTCPRVSALGWDPLRAELHQGSADQPRVGREIDTGVTAERIGSGELFLANRTLHDDHQAEALAQAELDRRSAQEVTLHGLAEGDPLLRPGTPVEIREVARSLNGRYVLTAVDHTVDCHQGFVSALSTAPPPPQVRARAAVATVGLVDRVDDPDGLGRIKISLPALGELESEWLAVVMPGAGAGKGLVCVPNVGDQVLALLPQDDPAQGLVLGGLYGAEAPPYSGIIDGVVQGFGLLTAGGQQLRMEDEAGTLRMENASGSLVELTPDKVRLLATTDLEIAAPGCAVVIRGKSIDFERA